MQHKGDIMKIRTAPLQTKQGDIVYLAEQTVNYCTINNITLSVSKTSCSHNQRVEIIELLRQLPSISTLEFRELGYMTPQPRIFELREKYDIRTTREDAFDRTGILHKRVGRYALVGQARRAA